MKKKLLPQTVPKTARLLGVAENTVRAWLKQGRLGQFPADGIILVDPDSIREVQKKPLDRRKLKRSQAA